MEKTGKGGVCMAEITIFELAFCPYCRKARKALKALAEGTLEYMGTNSAYCITRPFVMDGAGRFKNSTSCFSVHVLH